MDSIKRRSREVITRREMLDNTMSAVRDSWENAEYIEISVYDGIPLGHPPKKEDCTSDTMYEMDLDDYIQP